jgi:hypothetical protein
MEVLRLERAVVLARKSKPAWGLRLNGPRERICFASSYFLPGFSRFLLFLDCDQQPKQLSDTISGNIYTKNATLVQYFREVCFTHWDCCMAQWLSGFAWLVPAGLTFYKNKSRERTTVCVLFRLPDAIGRLVLVEWLGVKYVARLDSAFCDRASRAQFYCLAYSQFTVFTLNPYGQYKDSTAVLRWAALRTAQIDGFCLPQGSSTSDELLQKIFAVSGGAVRWVASASVEQANYSSRQQTLLEVGQRCSGINAVIVSCDYVEDWGECLITLTRTLTKLTQLSLRGVTMSKPQLTTILTQCTHLEQLGVKSGNPVIPVEVALPTLISLRTYCTCLSDEVLVAIGQRCAKLETLCMFKPAHWNADSHRVTDVGVRAVLEGCPLLQHTDVEEARGISCELRRELARRRCFTNLKFYQWEHLSEEWAQELLKVCPNLTSLNCQHCERLTDSVLAVCAEHCPLLESIRLEDCELVSNGGVRELVSKAGGNLRQAFLGHCALLSDDAVLAVAGHCPNLEQLASPRLILDSTVVTLAVACPNLTHVYLSSTRVSDVGLTALATHCPNLKEVYLYCCRRVTMQGVRVLATNCKNLTKLALDSLLCRQRLPPQLRRNRACVVVYG